MIKKVVIIFIIFIIAACKGEKPYVITISHSANDNIVSYEKVLNWILEKGFDLVGGSNIDHSVITKNYTKGKIRIGITYLDERNSKIIFAITPESNSEDLSLDEIVLIREYFNFSNNLLGQGEFIGKNMPPVEILEDQN